MAKLSVISFQYKEKSVEEKVKGKTWPPFSSLGQNQLVKFAITSSHQTPTSSSYAAPPMAKRRDFYTGAEINRFLQLPEEVVEEILLRLPADSLKNCKRVCKWWFKLINDPSFINKHLVLVTSKDNKFPRTIFLKCIQQELSLEEDIFNPYSTSLIHANDPSKLVLLLLTIDDNDHGEGGHLPCAIELVHLLPLHEENLEDFPTNFCAQHCNGIIHLFDRFEKGTVVLLSPALGHFKLLQEPDLPPSPNFDFFLGCGFGYDPKSNVYKYVKIFGDRSYHNPVAMVHTLGTDSWREIKIDVQGKQCSPYPKGVYCKGAYYWLNSPRIGNMLLSFDLSEEKFRILPIFPGRDLRRKPLVLDVWNESVVLFIGTESSWSCTCFEMWVMVDDFGDVEGSSRWIRHLKIGPLVCILSPLAFWKGDELLLETRDGRIVSYNLYTRKLRKVSLPGAVYPGFTYASLCFKSLVSV